MLQRFFKIFQREYRCDNQQTKDQLDRIENLLSKILEKEIRMSQEIDNLVAEVEKVKTVVGSTKALLTSLSQRIKDAGTDPAKLAALTADLDGSINDLSQAVVENTPAA